MAVRLTTIIVISIVAATFIAGIITRAQRRDTRKKVIIRSVFQNPDESG